MYKKRIQKVYETDYQEFLKRQNENHKEWFAENKRKIDGMSKEERAKIWPSRQQVQKQWEKWEENYDRQKKNETKY